MRVVEDVHVDRLLPDADAEVGPSRVFLVFPLGEAVEEPVVEGQEEHQYAHFEEKVDFVATLGTPEGAVESVLVVDSLDQVVFELLHLVYWVCGLVGIRFKG